MDFLTFGDQGLGTYFRLGTLDLGLSTTCSNAPIFYVFAFDLTSQICTQNVDTSFEIGNLIRACSSEDRFKSVQIKICITTRDGNQVMGNDFCKEMRFRPGKGRISRDNNKFLQQISKACCITIFIMRLFGSYCIFLAQFYKI